MIEVVAQDDLPAYTLPSQTREKLFQIERLTNMICTSMPGKWDELVYGDLLAGPGVCVDMFTREERRGSALIAAQRPEFSRLFINDVDIRVTEALRQRLGPQPEGRILINTGDCNAAVDAARDFLFPRGSTSKTLGLAVIDPSAYQMRFESIERLTSGGLRLDLMIVVMTSYMRRFFDTRSFENSMRQMLRDDQIAYLTRRRRSGLVVSYGDFLDCFKDRLASIGYPHADDIPALNSNGSPVYHIVYASRHPLGREFFQKASAKSVTGQIRLPLSILPS